VQNYVETHSTNSNSGHQVANNPTPTALTITPVKNYINNTNSNSISRPTVSSTNQWSDANSVYTVEVNETVQKHNIISALTDIKQSAPNPTVNLLHLTINSSS
jgi:hypothetical protein